MRVAAVVVNYRTAELSCKAVTSLLPELAELGPHHLYLVDNASGDDSLERLAVASGSEGWGARVTILPAAKNGGYGYGINLAVRAAMQTVDPPEYIYVLNSDALVLPGSLARLVSALDARPEAGIAGGRICSPEGMTYVTAFRFPSVLGELEGTARFGLLTSLLRHSAIPMAEPGSDEVVDWISGTSMLIRRRVFEEVGLFDEGFFLYYEETDFCHAARRAGWQTLYVSGAPVTHLGSASTGLGDDSRALPGYWYDSRHRYLRKYRGAAYTALCDAAWVTGAFIWRGKQRLLGRPTRERPRLLRDFVTASLRNLLAG
jgi:hypothetical protein